MILSQTEYLKREKDFPTTQTSKRDDFNLDVETQSDSPPEEKREEDDEKKRMIDDVYDANAVKPFYELQSLRKNGILNQIQIMEMTYDIN